MRSDYTKTPTRVRIWHDGCYWNVDAINDADGKYTELCYQFDSLDEARQSNFIEYAESCGVQFPANVPVTVKEV